MWCKDTAQWLEGQRAFSNATSKKAAGPAYGKDWRWFTGVPGHAVLNTCLQVLTLRELPALTGAAPPCTRTATGDSLKLPRDEGFTPARGWL